MTRLGIGGASDRERQALARVRQEMASDRLSEVDSEVRKIAARPGEQTLSTLRALSKALRVPDERSRMASTLREVAEGLPPSARRSVHRAALIAFAEELSQKNSASAASRRGAQQLNELAKGTSASSAKGLTLAQLSPKERRLLATIKTSLDGESGWRRLARALQPALAMFHAHDRDRAMSKAVGSQDIASLLAKLDHHEAARYFGGHKLEQLEGAVARAFYGTMRDEMLARMATAYGKLTAWRGEGLAAQWASSGTSAARVKLCRELGIDAKTAQHLGAQHEAPLATLRAHVETGLARLRTAMQATARIDVYDARDCAVLSRVGGVVKADLLIAGGLKNGTVLTKGLEQVAAKAHDHATGAEATITLLEGTLDLFVPGKVGLGVSILSRGLQEGVKITRADQARDIAGAGRVGAAGVTTPEVADETERDLARAKQHAVTVAAKKAAGVAVGPTVKAVMKDAPQGGAKLLKLLVGQQIARIASPKAR